jgi:DNA-binding LacI/PurR family transcriptional regulator
VDPDQSPSPSQRSAAYYSALQDAAIPVDPQFVVRVEWGGEQGAEAMAQLLSVKKRATSVYDHSDEVALGAIRTIRRAGLRVPEDVSVVGIDGHELAATFDLTTVAQPVHDLGAQAARWLVARLAADADDADEDDDADGELEGVEAADDETPHVHSVQLVVRGSSGPPIT